MQNLRMRDRGGTIPPRRSTKNKYEYIKIKFHYDNKKLKVVKNNYLEDPLTILFLKRRGGSLLRRRNCNDGLL